MDVEKGETMEDLPMRFFVFFFFLGYGHGCGVNQTGRGISV